MRLKWYAYIWDDIDDISSYYHDSGGLVIVTNRDPQEVWDEFTQYKKQPECLSFCSERSQCELHPPRGREPLGPPDHEYELVGIQEEKVIRHLNRGCC